MRGSYRHLALGGVLSLFALVATAPSQEWPGNKHARLEITQAQHDRAGPGKPLFLDVRIRNLGPGEARSVCITGALPDGAELIKCSPDPERQESMLKWSAGVIKPGEEFCIRMELRSDSVPSTGDWPNKVRVSYQSEIGHVHNIDRSRPKLGMSLTAPS